MNQKEFLKLKNYLQATDNAKNHQFPTEMLDLVMVPKIRELKDFDFLGSIKNDSKHFEKKERCQTANEILFDEFT